MFFIVLGMVIVLVLAGVAVYYLRQVKTMQAIKTQQLKELDNLKNDHNNYLNRSVQVLAQGLVAEQLSLTEGAIRISVLLDNLKIDEDERNDYSALFQLAEATSHIPILDAWNRLSKKEKNKFEKIRASLEAQYKDFVVDAARRLKGKSFS
jgi:flagellar biogenesis protein FliO